MRCCSIEEAVQSGMTARSCPPGHRPSRAVALWADGEHGLQVIELAAHAEGILITTAVRTATRWTADGGRHDDVPSLSLTNTYDLRLSPTRHD
jgi:hypothetical protein